MQFNKAIYLREELEQLDSSRLNELLQAEAKKESQDMDEGLIQKILTVLENRESPRELTHNAEVQAAIERYRKGCENQPKQKRSSKWILRSAYAAAIAAVILLAIPKASGENLFYEFLTKVTQDVIAFFTPDQSDNQLDYQYKTDHSGLQQVYDTLTEQGVTVPIVPSWMPVSYELIEIKENSGPSKHRVVATFANEEKTIILTYEIYGIATTHEYHRDETPARKYERAGIIHEIYLNNRSYLVFWKQDNIESFIVADCLEDYLIRILDSIYMMEDQ